MGVVNANVVISNPADRSRNWEGRFLVDTGATDSLVPRQHLEAIGLAPEAQRTYLLADGSEIRMDVAVARIELLGEIVGGTVLYAFAVDRSVIMVCGEERSGRLPFDIQHRTVIKYTSESKGDFDSLGQKISERASKLLEKNEVRQIQAVTELAERGSDERKLLESIQTHVRTHGGAAVPRSMRFDYGDAS